jgi:hypothetical protein
MEHFELMLLDSRDFQSAGVGTNIDRCVRLHCRGSSPQDTPLVPAFVFAGTGF